MSYGNKCERWNREIVYKQVILIIAHLIAFFKYMLNEGVFFAPSLFEAGFISSSHTKKEFDHTVNAFIQVQF